MCTHTYTLYNVYHVPWVGECLLIKKKTLSRHLSHDLSHFPSQWLEARSLGPVQAQPRPGPGSLSLLSEWHLQNTGGEPRAWRCTSTPSADAAIWKSSEQVNISTLHKSHLQFTLCMRSGVAVYRRCDRGLLVRRRSVFVTPAKNKQPLRGRTSEAHGQRCCALPLEMTRLSRAKAQRNIVLKVRV